ncbi:MAG: sensor histidine kinase, partial [Bacillota bacterium]
CIISAAFYIVSSSVIVGWITTPAGWPVAALYAEILWSTALGLALGYFHPNGPAGSLFTAIFVTLFFSVERRWLKPVLVATTLLWLLTFLPQVGRQSPLDLGFQIALYGAFHLFAATMGNLMRNLHEEKERSDALLAEVNRSRAALERAHRQLTESAARQQQMAVLEERQRLAREIHDSVAHNLTALVVQLQAARRLLDRAPEQSAEGLARCEEMARQALHETRQAVRALHPTGLGQQSEVEALRRLGRDFGAATGIAVTVEATEAVGSLPPDPNRVEQLYRIFQEAMTNAHRHGGARAISCRLALVEGGLEMVVTNDGAPPASLEPGIGLRAMAERARSLGGEVRFEPGASGLAVRVRIPVKQEAVG